MALVSKSSKKGAKAHFSALSAPAPRVSPKGGHRVGPTKCAATRAHGNVRSSY